MERERPTRCISPVIKFCQECPYGHVVYAGWVECSEDLSEPGSIKEAFCTLGFDQGRPEDEPTEEELREFKEWCIRDHS